MNDFIFNCISIIHEACYKILLLDVTTYNLHSLYVRMQYVFKKLSFLVVLRFRAVIRAHTALYPHEVMHHKLAITFPLHGISLGFLGNTAPAALTRGAVFGTILFHARTPVVLKFDVLDLAPSILALSSLLQIN